MGKCKKAVIGFLNENLMTAHVGVLCGFDIYGLRKVKMRLLRCRKARSSGLFRL
jgi:hypothetical protein